MDALLHFTRELARQPARHAVRLVEPPFCYGAWRGPRIDLPVLELRVRDAGRSGAIGVVLSDIPDDDQSLLDALAVPGVLGALAVGCAHLDLWVLDPIAAALAEAIPIRRSADSPLVRAEIHSPEQARVAWARLEACRSSSS